MQNLRILRTIAYLKGAYFQTPILSLFFLAQGVPLSVIVAANMFWSIGSFGGEVPTGLFADNYGQRLSLILGYALEAIGILLVFFYTTPAMVLVYFTISGISGAFLSGSEEAILYESAKADAGMPYQKVYGRFLSNEQVGFMVTTALAGLAYAYFGSPVFPYLILLTAAAFLFAAFLATRLSDVRGLEVEESKGSGMFGLLKESLELMWRNRTVRVLIWVSVLTMSGQYLMQAVYQPYFSAHAVPALWLGLVLTLGTALNLLAMRYVYVLEKHFTLEKILLMLNLPLGLMYILLSIFVHPVFLVGVYIAMIGIYNLQKPVISDYINSRSKSHIRTTVLSGISFVVRIWGIIWSLVLTYAVSRYGTEAALASQGVYLIIGAVVSYLLLLSCGCTHKIYDTGYRLE